MFAKLAVLVAVLGFSAGPIVVAVLGFCAGQRRDVDDITYYSCAGKADGNYEHPWNYTQFITCHNGRASERDCAACHVNPTNCPDGMLCFVESIDRCEWVNDARCHIDKQHSTTEADITTPAEESTTPEPGTPSTPNPTDPGNGFCKPIPTTCSLTDDCTGSGCCQDKWICVRDDSPLGPFYDTHRVVTTSCGTNPATGEPLYFNPDPTNPFGGTCTNFGILPIWVKEQYRNDKTCIDRCVCKPKGEIKCSSEYTCYKEGKTQDLKCGPGEGFDQFEGCTSDCK